MKTQNVGFVHKHFSGFSARRVDASRAHCRTQWARVTSAHRAPNLTLIFWEARSGPHRAGDRKGKGQSTRHAVGARKGKTSFRVTVAPGAGIEFVDVGKQCPSNVIWYGGICVRVHMRAYVI